MSHNPSARHISRERKRHALRMVRKTNMATRGDLNDDARLLYTIGCLIADDTGGFSRDEVMAAAQDPSMCAIALAVLAAAGGVR